MNNAPHGAIRHRFVLISRWHLSCGIQPAWRCICTLREWSTWWPQVKSVQVDSNDCADDATPRVGNTAHIEWKTGLGYALRLRLTTTGVLAPFELEGTAEGDLNGHGLWVLEPRHQDGQPGVRITYRWDVHLNRPWMRLCSPLLRPVFARNHFSVMRAGAQGMARHVGCDVSEYEDFRFSPGGPTNAAAPLGLPQPHRR